MLENERYTMIKTIEEWISKGFSKKNLHNLIEQKFDLKSYGARNKVINEAYKEIRQDIDVESIRYMAVDRLDNIAELAQAGGDLKTAIKAIESYTKLMGLSVDKSEVKIDVPIFEIKFGNE